MDKVNALLKAYRAPKELQERVRTYIMYCRKLKQERVFRAVRASAPTIEQWSPTPPPLPTPFLPSGTPRGSDLFCTCAHTMYSLRRFQTPHKAHCEQEVPPPP